MSRERIKLRAEALEKSRLFFKQRDVLEVDCPALVKRAPLDANIDVISTDEGFLHTSPEYAMKRLLANGSGDIYFLGHVYRKGEIGRLHNPEFTMAEWYRIGFTLDDMIQETCEFLSLFLGKLPVTKLSYRDAFTKYANVNYTDDPLSGETHWSRTEKLHYLLSHKIEPELGQNELTVITDYPEYEAAQAHTIQKNGEVVAKRFEIYHSGVELANGYHELSDATEIRRRFERENRARIKQGLKAHLFDEEYLEALNQGLPDCSGVSVGFDRALMLNQSAKCLANILYRS